MRTTLVVPPQSEPLALGDVKLHLREDGDAQDALIASLIPAAREMFEADTGRQVCTATWEAVLDRFPCGPIILPRPPLRSVESITYIDTAGAVQTWGADEYIVETPAGPFAAPGRVYPRPGYAYPHAAGAVTVRFVAGYGSGHEVPDSIRAMLRILIADLYETREAQVTGTIVTPSRTATLLLHRYRLPVFA